VDTEGHERKKQGGRKRGEGKTKPVRGSKLCEEGEKTIYYTPLDRDHSSVGRWASNGAQTDTLPFFRQRAGRHAGRQGRQAGRQAERRSPGTTTSRSSIVLCSSAAAIDGEKAEEREGKPSEYVVKEKGFEGIPPGERKIIRE